MDVKYLVYVRYYLVGNRAVQRQTQSGYLGRKPSWGTARTRGGLISLLEVEHAVRPV